MDTDTVFWTMGIQQCWEVVCQKSTVRDCFLSHRDWRVAVICLHAQTVQSTNGMRCSDNEQTSIAFSTMPVHSRSSISQIALETLQYDYKKYHGLADNSDDPRGQRNADLVHLDALVEEDLFWGQPAATGNVPEEVPDETRPIVTPGGHKLSDLKKRYLGMFSTLGDTVQRGLRELDATHR